jgi:hypothetical protein
MVDCGRNHFSSRQQEDRMPGVNVQQERVIDLIASLML